MRNSKTKLSLSVVETEYMKLLKLEVQQAIEQTETKSSGKGMFMKVLKIISVIISFFAVLLTCLFYLGWLEPIKAFIRNILWPK
jgi:hypothetical protein